MCVCACVCPHVCKRANSGQVVMAPSLAVEQWKGGWGEGLLGDTTHLGDTHPVPVRKQQVTEGTSSQLPRPEPSVSPAAFAHNTGGVSSESLGIQHFPEEGV